MRILRGRVIRYQSGFYTVETGEGTYTCQLRGRLKRGPREGDIVALGDWVQFEEVGPQEGMIEGVDERTSMISRMAPLPQGEYQQIIIANPDQVVFVYACVDPEPRFRMLDRFLVSAEREGIPSLIVANKLDLVGQAQAEALFGRYDSLGYPVIYTSAHTRQGLDQLEQRLLGKVSALAGPSGVGKSSLLNAIQPGLGLAVRDVSQATGKGQHTTVVRQLFPLEGGGYIGDTPGMKALALWDIEPEELDAYFPELRELVAECQFSDCTHIQEPGCAVLAAVDAGSVHPERYESYVRMREDDSD